MVTGARPRLGPGARVTSPTCPQCGGTGVVCHVLAEGGEAGVGSWRIWQTADALCECKRSELDYRNDRDSGAEGAEERAR